MEYDAFSSTSTQMTTPCDICGRNFNPEALSRHAPICSKSNAKKRKVFDSTKQRAEGTELKQFNKSQRFANKSQPTPTSTAKKNNWRHKHNEFINAIRGAKGVQQAIDRGEPLPPPPPATINPDYVQCPYCDRRFNDGAAQRHMPFCKEQHERLPNKNKPSNQAMARAQARQYKGPKLGKGQMPSPPGSGTAPNSYSYNNSARLASNPGPVAPRHGGSGHSSLNSQSPGNDYAGGVNGRALRTGRTAETYSDARQLSAKQRQSMPSKSPSARSDHDDRPRYGGGTNTGPTRVGPIRSGDTGYYSGDSDTHRGAKTTGRMGSGAARFCHECGTKYPVVAAKFCCECGVRRMNIT